MLRVLCILSFFGCGSLLVFGVMGYSSYKAQATRNTLLEGIVSLSHQASASSAAASAMDNAATDPIIREEISNLNKMATSSLIVGLLNILVLIGVVMMWKLKKAGFYVYTLGQVASVATPFLIVGSLAGGLMATLGAIFPILFIILYGLNLKHMS